MPDKELLPYFHAPCLYGISQNITWMVDSCNYGRVAPVSITGMNVHKKFFERSIYPLFDPRCCTYVICINWGIDEYSYVDILTGT